VATTIAGDERVMGIEQNQTEDEALVRARRDKLARCFSTLDKVIRGVRLYEGRGPLVDRLTNDLSGQLAEALEEGEITVGVSPIGLVYAGMPLSPSDEKPARYLFRLFCDGVRELTILPGVEDTEIRALVEVLTSKSTSDDEDLVTLLWKRDLAHIQYFAADTLDMSIQVDVEGEISMAYHASEERIRQGSNLATGSEMRLSKDDLRVLRQDESLEWVRECEAPARAHGNIAEAAGRIRDAFVVPGDFTRFLGIALRMGASGEIEASPMVLNMIDAQLRNGILENVAPILEAIVGAAEEGHAEAVALQAALCTEDRMALIAPIYSRHPEALTRAIQALARADDTAIVKLLAHLDDPEAQTSLHGIVNDVGIDLTPFYRQQLQSSDEEDIIKAIHALAKIGSPPAIESVSQSLAHTLAAVRHAALEAMQGRYDPSARVAIGRAARDPDPKNRELAIRLLADSGDNRVTWILLSAVQDASFHGRGKEEQDLLLTALAAFKDARTVDFFKKMLSKGGLLGKKAAMARQLKAARALGAMGTPESREALESCRGKWGLPKPVKEEISRLLAGGGG
jgi:HEAT repeat protein